MKVASSFCSNINAVIHVNACHKHACNLCDKRFRFIYILDKHLIDVHGCEGKLELDKRDEKLCRKEEIGRSIFNLVEWESRILKTPPQNNLKFGGRIN